MTGGHLWVLGDSWADPTVYPWAPAQGWPELLAARLGIGLVNSGVSGTGYAANAGAPNFPAQAARGTGAGAAAVLVWGSLNDPVQGHPAWETRAGAATTYGLIHRLCPDAPLIVAGPQWGADPPTAELLAAREAVRSAAADAGALFLDPSGWLTGHPELVLPDGLHPDPAGHALIADRLTPELMWALPGTPGGSRDWSDEGGWVAPYTLGVPAGTDPASPIPSAA